MEEHKIDRNGMHFGELSVLTARGGLPRIKIDTSLSSSYPKFRSKPTQVHERPIGALFRPSCMSAEYNTGLSRLMKVVQGCFNFNFKNLEVPP